MKAIVVAGGTGGHIYPAVAIAKALIETGHKVFFVGNKKNNFQIYLDPTYRNHLNKNYNKYNAQKYNNFLTFALKI